MKISEVMSPEVRIADPDDTIQDAAQIMEENDVGFLPVGEDDRLVGMITDRDIALRAVAKGKDPHTTLVRDVMTTKVLYCYDSDDVEAAADNMAELRVRRLPIVNADKRLVGVVSIGDIAFLHSAATAGKTLEGVCTPGGTRFLS
ncbi:MAG TPA: CBS domain-containing protein [Rhizomicrobium sp.]